MIVQAAGLLQQPNKTEEDMETLLDTCFLLNSVQVHKLLTNFRDEMVHLLLFVSFFIFRLPLSEP